MSHPILYSSTETNFEHDGIGILSDCILCEVTEERNGSYELTMKYPLDGVHYEDIKNRSIIKATLDKFRNEQPFRVYAISRPLNGIVTINAQHISYDLSGIPVSPFSADTASDALSGLKYNAVADCPFDFWTDKSTKAEFEFFAPASIRSRLGGVSGSILDVYGGEYEFDNFTVKLHEYRGMNRGVRVQYGVNLTDIKQEENCASVYTGIMPYWNAEEGVNLVTLPEKIVKASGEYDFEKIKVVDFSSDFEVEPTEDELRAAAESYIEDNDIGIPSVSLTVSFAQLDKDAESVSLCDTVNIEFEALKVEATAKIIKIVYDVLLDRVKSISLGNARTNIADTIVSQKNSIDDISSIIPKKTDIEAAIESATKWITNGAGYMIAVKDEAGNWKEICSLDTPDINSAVNVWRWNNGGFGHSKSGYNGPYETAITQDGQIVADFITAGSMSANRVKTGVLASSDGTVNLNLDDGGFHVSATKHAPAYSFSFDDDGNLILTYTGEAPDYSIDEDGNLILTYTGDKPDIWIDKDGNVLTTEESLATSTVLGTLTTDIDGSGTWESKYTVGGETVSSLYFDFANSRFTFDGCVIATSGEIGGCSIIDGKLVIPAANITGKLVVGNLPDGVAMTDELPDDAYITEITKNTIKTTTITAQHIRVNAANIDGALTFGDDGSYYIDPSAESSYLKLPGLEITNEGATFEGVVTAKNGYIGKWEIGDDGLIYGVSSGTRIYTTSVSPDGATFQTSYGTAQLTSRGVNFLNSPAVSSNTNSVYTLVSLWQNGLTIDFPSIVTSSNHTEHFIIGYEEKTYIHFNAGFTSGNNWSSASAVLVGTWTTDNDGSDARIKNTIEELPERYETLFDGLVPSRYKYNHGTSGRFHTGFIAQEVVSAIENAGLTTQDFAGVMLMDEGTEDECWYLRRDEFVALNTWQIQKLKARVAELERKFYAVN